MPLEQIYSGSDEGTWPGAILCGMRCSELVENYARKDYPEYIMTSILEKILENPAYKESGKKIIEKAFEFAKTAHAGQKRLSG